MAAPTATPRVTPAGDRLRDGDQTLITFASDSNIELFEMAATPPPIDGGDMIETTTFHNSTRRTKWPRRLIEDGNGQFRCAYDPVAKTRIEAIINTNTEITVTFNDGSTWAFWGALIRFTPQEAQEGQMPEAIVEFGITNTDSAFAEQDPVVVEVAGS